MESKVFVSAILFASWFYVGFSQQKPAGVADLEFDCMESIMPCEPFLQESSSPPPSSCCTPMKKMVKTNNKCVCAVFDNVPLLKTLNVTQEEALKLPKACGAEADLTVCESLKEDAVKALSSATNSTTESDPKGGSGGSSGPASSTGVATSSTPHQPPGKTGVILASMAAWMSIFV